MSRPTRSARIERLAAEVQQRIVSCPNEQTFDEGDIIWIFGSSTSVRDLLGNADVPEDLEDEVIAALVCPKCNSPLDAWQDVGTQYSFELHHEGMLASAAGRFYESLIQFREFLKMYPSLGATHPVGRKILREVEKFPKSALPEQAWFRARPMNEVTDPTPDQMMPPNPLKHRIHGGRFNHAEQSHWYLASSPDSAVAEITTKEERSAWVQEFRVPPLAEILDLRAYRPEDERALDEDGEPREYPLLAVALIFGELLYHAQERGAEFHPEYLVPRFVADAAKHKNYAGICHRSPRHYGENLVVFDSMSTFAPVGKPRLVTLDDDTVKQRERLYFDSGFPCFVPDFPALPHLP
jgi:hypothetical protein